MTQVWPFTILLLGWLSLYLIGRQRQIGWAVSILSQLVWAVYAAVTGQWAFIAGSVVYVWLAVLGWRRLRRTQAERR